MRKVGVEEEFLLVDAHDHRAAPVATRVLRIATARGDAGGGYAGAGSLACELQEQQLEAYTSPHTSMAALEAELRGWRSKAASAAEQAGARVVASATSPVEVEPLLVRTARYVEMAERFASVAREQLTCGCHVHVAVGCYREAVGVLDRIRVWLPTLVAVSANSAVLAGPRHRLRELPFAGAAPLAGVRADRDLRHAREISWIEAKCCPGARRSREGSPV